MSWRLMTPEDMPRVQVLADTIHVGHPEDLEVLAERQRLYPQGCLMLTEDEQAIGYALTHPWHYGEPPPLNGLLGKLPVAPTSYYIHDIALLPVARGSLRQSVARRSQQVSGVLGEGRLSRAVHSRPGRKARELRAGCGAHGARSGKADT